MGAIVSATPIVAAFALSITFLVAAMQKAADPDSVRLWLVGLNVARPRPVLIGAVVIEFLISILAVAHPRVGGLAAAVFLVLATALIAKGHSMGVEGCSCFGAPVKGRPLAYYLLRNGGLIAVAIAAFFSPARGWQSGVAVVSVLATAYVAAVFFDRLEPNRFSQGVVTQWSS